MSFCCSYIRIFNKDVEINNASCIELLNRPSDFILDGDISNVQHIFKEVNGAYEIYEIKLIMRDCDNNGLYVFVKEFE